MYNEAEFASGFTFRIHFIQHNLINFTLVMRGVVSRSIIDCIVNLSILNRFKHVLSRYVPDVKFAVVGCLTLADLRILHYNILTKSEHMTFIVGFLKLLLHTLNMVGTWDSNEVLSYCMVIFNHIASFHFHRPPFLGHSYIECLLLIQMLPGGNTLNKNQTVSSYFAVVFN